MFESAFYDDPTAISYSDPNMHRFNHYADKQLQHLVVAEEFNFEKIATMLSTRSCIQIIFLGTKELATLNRAAVKDGQKFIS